MSRTIRCKQSTKISILPTLETYAKESGTSPSFDNLYNVPQEHDHAPYGGYGSDQGWPESAIEQDPTTQNALALLMGLL